MKPLVILEEMLIFHCDFCLGLLDYVTWYASLHNIVVLDFELFVT